MEECKKFTDNIDKQVRMVQTAREGFCRLSGYDLEQVGFDSIERSQDGGWKIGLAVFMQSIWGAGETSYFTVEIDNIGNIKKISRKDYL